MQSNNKNKGSQDFYLHEPVNTWVGGDAYN